MTTILELTVFPDGRQESHSKQFKTKKDLFKSLGAAGLDGRLVYELKKNSKAKVEYEGGIFTLIEISDANPLKAITDEQVDEKKLILDV